MTPAPMVLPPWQTVVMILAVAAGCLFMRFLPFWIFPDSKQPPPAVAYLGRALSPAVMGLLVVYCLRNVNVLAAPYALPEAAAIACVAALHCWKRNVLLSIGAGTAVYMVLIRVAVGG
ncbi:MAG: AzlD domain-containing protein [Clostridia bacterium]|nr:AzlD domain-containing protein [Clostridia bacterium]